MWKSFENDAQTTSGSKSRQKKWRNITNEGLCGRTE